MGFTGGQNPHTGDRQPTVHNLQGLVWRQGLSQDSGMGGDAEKSEKHNPWQPDRLDPGKHRLQPFAGPDMMGTVGIDGVQQKIEVDEFQGRYLRLSSSPAVSVSSKAPASARALSRSIPDDTGTPIWTTGHR